VDARETGTGHGVRVRSAFGSFAGRVGETFDTSVIIFAGRRRSWRGGGCYDPSAAQEPAANEQTKALARRRAWPLGAKKQWEAGSAHVAGSHVERAASGGSP